MKTTALFYRSDNGQSINVEPLLHACRRRQFLVQDQGGISDQQSFRSSLPKKPAVLFLPAIEKDCLGVKLVQEAMMDAPPRVLNGPPRVLLLYAPSLPSKEFLCLAFREGVDDILALDAEEPLDIQITRAERLLQTRLDSSFAGGEMEEKINAVRRHCEQLERNKARWKERFLALASTALRMATGELRLSENPPSLLIVAASNSQASSAEELASRIGFDTQVVHHGAEALEEIQKRPPRVILTDGTLPDMDAAVLAHSARQALGKRPVMIVAWSSNPAARDALLAPEAGIDDFVLKSSTGESADLLSAALLGALR